MRIWKLCLLLLLCANPAPLVWALHAEQVEDHFQLARRAVVNVQVSYFRYSYKTPWRNPYIGRASGTGFILEGNRIITNAHLVSGAVSIRLQRPNQNTDYEAETSYIAHDCDLALLKVKDASFFKDSASLSLGELPALNTPVDVIGFPIGGDRVSITKGVVSRIDMDVYSHSGIDEHLIIQVDAAINPGNSGGPAMQGGRVIGAAFQARTNSENQGYLIPAEVIERFLQDIKDGSYDGYTEFGLITTSTSHPALRKALNIQQKVRAPLTGLYVYAIIPDSSADGHIQAGDILTQIHSHPITEKGDVLINGDFQNYTRLVDNLHKGEKVEVELLRNGKLLKRSFPSKITTSFQFYRKKYGHRPSYVILGGLVFQALDANLMANYASYWSKLGHSEISYRYHYFFLDKIYKEVREDVILSTRLPHKVNQYTKDFVHRIVKKVNGIPVRGLRHFSELIARFRNEGAEKGKKADTSPYIKLEFYQLPIALILETEGLGRVESQILQEYAIQRPQFLNPAFY